MDKLQITPISLKDANMFVEKHHRHCGKVVGAKCAIGVINDSGLHGVAIIGRPVNINLDNGITAEIRRLCTDGTKNVCSMLYGAAWRIAKNMGYKKLITYILESEPGTSLKAANWQFDGFVKGRS
jgi:hypothetical protein